MESDGVADVARMRTVVQSVVLDALRRRAAGESLPDEEVIASRPELAGLLREELAKIQQICAAGKDAGKPVRFAASTTDMQVGRTPGMLQIQCPHCRESFETARDTPVTEIVCSVCGGHFSLADDHARTAEAASLLSLSHFDLVERLGVGGFGSVWKARDRKLDRTVAVKIPHRGTLNNEDLEKFLREARAAAQLQHPNIVRVYEVGRQGDSAYIVSDFVRGVPLNDWLSGQQPTMRQAAEICALIADALQHAHDRGVVHRDLKPGNILIDGNCHPHLLDFGLARRDAGEVTVTVQGQVLGTPAYMSPEQAQGEAHTADGRSDIYSLGVILFELLTGELPFRGNPRMLMHQVIHDEPPSPRKLSARIPRDLETITLKCLAKMPSQRYQTARDVEADLKSYLRAEPIRARPTGRVERTIRWCRRNRTISATLIALFCSLVFGTLVSMWFALEARSRAKLAEESKQQLEEELRRNQLVSARLEMKTGDFRNAYRILTQPVPPSLKQEWQWLAWQYCRESRVLQRTDLRAILNTTEPIPPARTAGWGRLERVNGDLIASVWAHRTPPFSIDVGKRQPIKRRHSSVSPSPQYTTSLGDGNVLKIIPSTAKSTLGERVVLLNTNGKNIWSLGGSGPAPTAVAASISQNIAAIGFENGAIQILRYKFSAESVEVLTIDTIRSTNETIEWLLFDADGSKLAGLSGDWIVWTWAWKEHGSPDIDLTATQTRTVRRLVPSADGRLLATASYRGQVHVWDTATKRLLAEINAHTSDAPRSGDIRVTKDNKRIVTNGYRDSQVRIWNVEDGTLVDTVDIGAAGQEVSRFELVRNDTELYITVGSQMQHWDLTRKKRMEAFPTEKETDAFIYAFKFVPNSSRIVLVYSDEDQAANTARTRRCEIWEADTCSRIAVLPDEHQNGLRDVDISCDGTLMAISSRDGTATIWDVQQLRLLHRLNIKPGNGHANIVSSVSFHPTEPVLVTASHDNRVIFWSTQSGRELASINVDSTGERGYSDLGLLKEAEFSPDGSTLFVAVGGEIFWIDLTCYNQTIQQMHKEQRSKQEQSAYLLQNK